MLELKNVRKVYTTKAGDVAALDGISILFPEKGMVFITGKSGSGKTTLLNVIGGLDGIDEGEIEVFGKKFSEFSQSEYDSYRNTLIGFIFQEYNLLPDYTIEKNVGIANELQGAKTDSEDVKDILASVDILSYEGRKPSQLSGGQKQRVAIARALIKNPKIIMADEPTGALDSNTGIQVIEELKRLSKEKLVIVISHDLELANKYADRIIRLVDGKVVEDVTIDEVEVSENVFEEENLLTVKSGSELDANETKALLSAIKAKKKIKFTDNFKIKTRKPTDVDAIEKTDEKIKFIKSKMKFRSAASLGLKSLKVKPLRLIFTILLSAIAFAVFGVFDTVASYERARAISDLLQNGKYENLMVSAQYDAPTGASINSTMSQEYIDELSAEANYKFRPVYNVQDFVSERYASVDGNYTYDIMSIGNQMLPQHPGGMGKGYYYAEMEGVIEFKNSEVDEFYNITPYGYYPIAGRYPKLYGTEGSTAGYVEVAISKYLADSIMYRLQSNAVFFGKKITSYEDLLEAKFKPAHTNMASNTPPFIIVGIYNCGDIPSDYDLLKTAYVQDRNDPNKALIEEFNAYLCSGAQKLLMVAEGEIERTIDSFGKPIAYFDEPAEYWMDDVYDHGSDDKKVQQYFFEQKTVPAKNVVMFDTLYPYGKDDDGNDLYRPTDTYTLKDNEVLINASDFELLFTRELARLDIENKFTKEVYATTLKGYTNEIHNYGVQGKGEQLRAALINAFNVANTHLTPVAYEEGFSMDGYFKDDLFVDGKHLFRNITLYRRLDSNDVTYEIPLKVVGVYYGIQKTNQDTYHYEPIVFNKDTLKFIGINTDQGYYQSATSLINTDKKSCNAIAERLVISQGVSLKWYKNTILDTLSKNETWVNQFTDLFLYASLVLAVFSMFMLFNYISASIVSKRQSIGVLRALGSGSSDVFKMFITESIVISLINGVLACLTSWIACTLVNNYLVNVMHFVVNFALFGVRQVFVIFGISILAAIISSIMPIVKIAREKPVDLIRRP